LKQKHPSFPDLPDVTTKQEIAGTRGILPSRQITKIHFYM
jgi:hypothetical protein